MSADRTYQPAVDLRTLPLPDAGRRIWGRWTYDPRLMTLTWDRWRYEVDLEKFTSSAKCLDVIFQVSRKRWATPNDVCDLIEAIHALVNPQANLCSFGRERGPFNAKSGATQ